MIDALTTRTARKTAQPMLDALLTFGGYVTAGLMLLFGGWQVFTTKTLPQKWQDWGLWPHNRMTPPLTALQLAARPTPAPSTTSRWTSVAMLVLGLTMLVFLAARHVADDRVGVIEKDLVDLQDVRRLEAEAAQAAQAAKDAEINALRERLDSLTASLMSALGEQRAQEVIASAPAVPLGPLSLFTRTGVTPAAYEDAMTRIRSERNLRTITEDELGRRVSQMPVSTYYYVVSGFNAQPGALPREILNRDTVQRTVPELMIELQTLENGDVHLVGFIDEASLRVVNLDGVTDRTIVLYPMPSEVRSVLTSIPVERVQASAGVRTAQLVLELTLR